MSIAGGIPVLALEPSTGNGQVWVTLRNMDERSPAPIHLAVGDFVSRISGRPLATQAALFMGSEGTSHPFLESTIEPGGTLSVRIAVANLREAGESVAELLLNGQPHSLRALQVNVPFNVGLVSPSAESRGLRLERGRSGLMLLKNDDPMGYAVAWRLFVPDEGRFLEGRVILPAASTFPLSFEPPGEWFRQWFEGLFKDERRSGHLTVAFAPAPDSETTGGPVRVLEVELSLAFWSETTRAWLGNGVLILVLLLGGLCSLYLSLWIPNKLAQIELTRQLDELAQQTRIITRKMDSELRVFVRVERLRLWEAVQSLSMLNGDTAERLKGFAKEIEALSGRVELVAAVDDVAQRLDALKTRTFGAPPTLLDQASRSLSEAIGLLKRRVLSEPELQQARSSIAAASSRLDRLDQSDTEFAARLAGHVKTLRGEFDEFQGDIGSRIKCRDLRPRLVDLFEILKSDRFEDPAAITPEKYHWIDVSIEKLFVLRHYIIRFEDTATDPKRQDRIGRCEADLMEYLKLQSASALELARRLREEIEQDVFPWDLQEQIQNGRVSIRSEPLVAYANRPVRLWAEFSDPRFDHCAALRELRCVWDFGATVGQEQGWEIVHYFRREQEAAFKVAFRTSDGKPVTGDDARKAALDAKVPFRSASAVRRSERSKVEEGRLLLALFIAILALISGAREQLLKLDIFPGLVAVFLVGFGADTVKNLFSKRV